MTTRAHRRHAAMVLALAAATSGCAVEENRRMTIGEEITLGTYSDEPAPASAAGGGVVNRENWATTRFVVPVDGTAAHATWRTHPESGTHATRRQRGEYPTPVSAVDTDEPYTNDQLGDTARAVGLSVVDAALMPGRVFVYPPVTEPYSPIESYERSPWEASPALPLTGRPVSAGGPVPQSNRMPLSPITAPTVSTPPTTTTPYTAPPPSRAPIQGLPPAPNPRPNQNIPPYPGA